LPIKQRAIGDLKNKFLPSFGCWQFPSDTVESPRAFMRRRMNHEIRLPDLDAP
jgi:hypothetical protein